MNLLRCGCFLVGLCGCLSFRGVERPSEDSPESQTAEFSLVNRCDEGLQEVGKDSEELSLSLRGFDDQMSSFEECGADGVLPGVDGFFSIEAESGERLLVRATPSFEEQDVGLFFLDSCDVGSCRKVQDRCGKGAVEYASFISKDTKSYIVGIDSSSEDAVDLELYRSVCGDGEQSPGEGCDDGNPDPGDGCDSMCRAEIAADAGTEVEPNDDTLEANVIAWGVAALRADLQGTLQSDCDVDRYRFSVPEGHSLTVQIVDGEGVPCFAEAPSIRLDLQAGNEASPILGQGRVGAIPEQGLCPGIQLGDPFATGLNEENYILSVRRGDDNAGTGELPFAYRLMIAVLPTAGAEREVPVMTVD